MKNYLKRISALLIAVMMVVAMCIPVSAAAPSASDKATITVLNVESGATVTAYQIVEADYNASSFPSYKAVDGVTVSNPTAPTTDEITAIAKNTANLTSQVLSANADGTYSAEVGAGYWLVLVTNSNTKIYNPMLAGVYYTTADGSIEGGNVNANDTITLQGTNIYAKSTSDPTIDKHLKTKEYENTNNGNDLAVGDSVAFEITTTIPSYSDQYNAPVFKITDKVSAGLTLPAASAVSVTVGGTAVTASDAEVIVSGDTLTINFTSAFIKANGTKNVVVEYSATLNANAGVNFVPNTNTATLEYSNKPNTSGNPGDPDPTDTTEDKTYHYTFAIDANLYGSSTSIGGKTSEIVKVDENGKVISKVETKDETVTDVTQVLTGATFTLTNKTTNKVYTAESDEQGYLQFTGLDAGTYTLVETVAPEGFQLDTTAHEVVISARYNADGTLASYSISIDGKATSTYTATYKNGTITNIEKQAATTEIKNTKLASLPSTGGMGTYVFTIVGVAVMVTAAGIFFAKRKERA